LGVEPGRPLAGGGEEPKERPQGRRDLPHPAAARASAGLCDERFDVGGAKLVEPLRTGVVVEEQQEPGDHRGVHRDRASAEATDALEVSPVVGDSTLGGRRRRRRQLASLL